MTSKERMVTALKGGVPDRLPVTTHHIMPSFLEKCVGGVTADIFFDQFGLDPIHWIFMEHVMPDRGRDEYFDPNLEHHVASSDWRFETESLSGADDRSNRHTIHTPKGSLSAVVELGTDTSWIKEHLIKKKSDIDLIGEYMTMPLCDIKAVNEKAEAYGERGLLRGLVPCFEFFGQPGCWQDAACLFGIENLIIAALEDSSWVHEFLRILQRRKLHYVKSLAGARFDILELGGGDASSTVISPGIFDEFVAPYDAEIIRAAHAAEQRIVYHTCGGMMPILESIAAMQPDAMETFTPTDMGGDADLGEAKRRIGGQVCMIGGFDQFHFFKDCTPEATRAEVRRCFTEAGGNGGFILCPSDHFFDADPAVIAAFADEASQCRY